MGEQVTRRDTGEPAGKGGSEPSRLRTALSDPARVWDLFGIPALILVALAGLWLLFGDVELTSREATRLNQPELLLRARQHALLSVQAAFWVIVIAVPLGIVVTRPWARSITPVVLALANAGQAIPSFGLLIVLAILLGTGQQAAVIAVVAYCILPVLRNTMVGIEQIDPAIIESGRGMGMTKGQVLRRIELPLAVPVVLAGVRTALILAVGTITLGALIGAGTLGVIINSGIVGFSDPVLVTGAVLTACFALFIDWLAGLAEVFLRPKGI
ncbi:ABC transporter permease [Egibacter rhizosphaerae]|uniref:ABC transporter permease n=1 Tax=Egibacter rhizosphaerae TaxID=1670831 RepID=A0A411YJU8_9ACTN|nr:ABC transporter permease [Egibacter rhizosphaerae]QBI21474.1 ABC transporter permease [Egibacter rhizosphaerae]